MRLPRGAPLKHSLILTILTVVMIFVYGGIDYTVEPYSGWDLSSYRKMASEAPGIAKDIGKPFVHRMLGPYVAGLLPLPDPAAFRALTVIVSIVLVLLFHSFLRHQGVNPGLSVITALLFVFNKYWFGFTSWDYFQLNDVLALLFIVAMFWSMLEGRWVVFGSALVLGAATKETSMLMVPALFAYLLEKRSSPRTWGSALIAVLPGVAVFLGVRVLLPVARGTGPVEAFLAYWSKIGSPERVFRLLVNSYLPLSLVPLVAAGATVRFFKTRKYALLLVVLVFASALFGANDERLMAPAFVVVYLLVAVILQDIELSKTALAVIVVAGLASSFHHIFARYPLSDRNVTQVLSLGALAVVTGVVLHRRVASRGRSR